MKSIQLFEPWFFIAFGVFQLHRIWGLIDEQAYIDFWLNTVGQNSMVYYFIIGILEILCIMGIITFFRNIRRNYRWRMLYFAGAALILADLSAISAGSVMGRFLLSAMFGVNYICRRSLLMLLLAAGTFSFILGTDLLVRILRQYRTKAESQQCSQISFR
ncbi:MAG: hypothetical protein PUA84_01210 [Oscillospiraceae bacterium]|nr:hypothetical protein [Oscillospiraceae bacterium]